jgi:hypothetical protein
MGIPLYGFEELTANEQREALEYGDWFPAPGDLVASNQVRETQSPAAAAEQPLLRLVA